MLKLDTILVPVDFSERSVPAAEHAAALARHFRSKLVFAHVVPPSPYEYVAFEGGYYTGAMWPGGEKKEQHLREELDVLVGKVASDQWVEELLLRGDPARKIEELISEKDVDLVVMPTHGYGPFRRFVLGSVTTKVLHDVDCPVLTGAHVEEIEPTELQPYRHVACAIDLLEYSETVLRWAWDFAEAYSAKLSVLHAVPYLEQVSLGSLVQAAKQQIEGLRDKVGARAEVVVESEEVHRLVPAIVREREVDLLFIGRSHREGLLGRLRTHAYALLRESLCPVISV